MGETAFKDGEEEAEEEVVEAKVEGLWTVRRSAGVGRAGGRDGGVVTSLPVLGEEMGVVVVVVAEDGGGGSEESDVGLAGKAGFGAMAGLGGTSVGRKKV